MLDRQDLAWILAIHEAGSLTAAADRLGVTGAAVTKRLAAIEQRLSLRLFERSTRSLAATEAGELAVGQARRVLDEFEALEARLSDHTQEPAGPIHLVGNIGFGRAWLGPLVTAFCRRWPRIEVSLHLSNRLPDLVAGGFDAAVWLWQPASDAFVVQTLASNHRVLVASPAYLRRHGTPATPQDLRAHECLLAQERDMPAPLWRLHRVVPRRSRQPLDVKVHGRLSSNLGELICDWALAGQGIALRPLWDVHRHLQSGRLVHVLPHYAKLESDVQWIAPYRTHVPRRVRLLREHLQAAFATPPWLDSGASPA